jgi:hypothetical protein
MTTLTQPIPAPRRPLDDSLAITATLVGSDVHLTSPWLSSQPQAVRDLILAEVRDAVLAHATERGWLA